MAAFFLWDFYQPGIYESLCSDDVNIKGKKIKKNSFFVFKQYNTGYSRREHSC